MPTPTHAHPHTHHPDSGLKGVRKGRRLLWEVRMNKASLGGVFDP